MTTFGKNLTCYRRRAGMTQEALAEALGVSRQAVGKWEAGASYPETEKLPALADVLGCSLDALLRGEAERVDEMAEQKTAEPTEQNSADAPLSETGKSEEEPGDSMAEDRFCESREGQWAFAAYDAHKNQFSLKIAVGVAMILTGVAAMLLLEARSENLAVFALLSVVAAAIALLITAGLSESAFWQEYPVVPDLYTREQQLRFRKVFGGGIAVGVALLIVAAAFMALGAGHLSESHSAAVFMMMIAGGVSVLVYLGIQHSKYFPETKKGRLIFSEEKKEEAGLSAALEEQVSQELVRAFAKTKEPGEEPEWVSVVMLCATAVFLGAGVVFGAWSVAWVVFPLGAIVCGIVEIVQGKKAKKEA